MLRLPKNSLPIYFFCKQKANPQSPPPIEVSSLANKAKVTDGSYFDTHAFVNALMSSGFTQKQSEQICYIFKDITNSMAQDIKKECATKPSQVEA
jgi:hypothetical protein